LKRLLTARIQLVQAPTDPRSHAAGTSKFPSPPAALLQPTSWAVAKAILCGGFRERGLERQYQEYHKRRIAVHDYHFGALQIVLAAMLCYKAGSAVETLIARCMLGGHLAVFLVLWRAGWRERCSRGFVMLGQQLLMLLPPSLYLLAGGGFPEFYTQMWRRTSYIPLLHAVVLASYYQVRRQLLLVGHGSFHSMPAGCHTWESAGASGHGANQDPGQHNIVLSTI
jgi:hypothetical protein